MAFPCTILGSGGNLRQQRHYMARCEHRQSKYDGASAILGRRRGNMANVYQWRYDSQSYTWAILERRQSSAPCYAFNNHSYMYASNPIFSGTCNGAVQQLWYSYFSCSLLGACSG